MRRGRWLEAIAVIAILAAAIMLRFWRSGQLPPGIDLDEARNGLEVLDVLAGHHPLFFTRFDPREPIFIYTLTLGVLALGQNALAMHATSAAWGVLGVALTYPVARAWFGRAVALLATAGMAVSLWDVAMSRWAERDITLLPFLLLFLYWLWRGLEKGSITSLVLAGISLSLCAYAYVAARILPVFVILVLLLEWRLVRLRVRGLIAAGLAAAVVVGPLAGYFLLHREAFFGRIDQISSVGAPLPGIAADSVWQTALNTLGMFFVHGDVNWRDNVAGWPVFGPWLAAFFCFGLVWAIRHVASSAKRTDELLGQAPSVEPARLQLRPCAWLILWQVLLLVPAFLARPSPQYDRTIGSAPSTYILLALGLAVAARWLADMLPARVGPVSWVLASGLIGISGARTAQGYFGEFANAAGPGKVFELGQTFDAAYLQQHQPPPRQTVFFVGFQSATELRYLTPRYTAGGPVWMEDFSRLLPLPAIFPATYIFAGPSLPLVPEARMPMDRLFPNLEPVASAEFADFTPAARVYQVDEAMVREALGVAQPIGRNIGDGVELVASSVPSELPAHAGQDVHVTLEWRVLQPASETYDAFVHVVDSAGKLLAQDDLQAQPTNGWVPGSEFLSAHVFQLPAGTPPGRYSVLAGIGRRTNEQPSRSLGELGPQALVLTLILEG